MPEELEKKLKDVQKNPAKSFKNGQNTSLITDTIKSGASMVGAYGFTTGLAKQITPELLQEVTKEVISYATQKVVEECTKIVVDYTKMHLQMTESIPSRLAQRTQDVFNDEKITFEEALSNLVGTPVENKIQKAKDEVNEKSKNEFIEKFKVNATAINQLIEEYSSEISNKLEDINKFIQAGPESLNSEIDKQVKHICKDIKSKIDKNVKEEQEAVDKFINQQGENAGQALAEKFNKEINEKALAYKQNQDKAKAKSNQMIRVKKQKGVLAIMAKMGL